MAETFYRISTTEIRMVEAEYEIEATQAGFDICDAFKMVQLGDVKPQEIKDLPADNRSDPRRHIVSAEITEMTRG